MTWRTRLAGAVLGLGVLASATGCAHSPTVAFVVDGTTVTEQQVTEAAESCTRSFNAVGATFGGVPTDFRGLIMTYQIYGAVAAAVSQRTGITISEDERLAALNGLGARGAGYVNDPLCREVALDVMAYTTLLSDLTKEDPLGFATQVGALDITVNPRYGQVDWASVATFGDSAYTGSGSLSMPYGNG